jgi:hypothetical protein
MNNRLLREMMIEAIEDYFQVNADWTLILPSGEIMPEGYQAEHNEEFSIRIQEDDQDLATEYSSGNRHETSEKHHSEVMPRSLKKVTIIFQNQTISRSLPDPTLSEIRKCISEEWKLPGDSYYLSVNGQHEENVTEWPEISTIRIGGTIKGGTQPPMGKVTLYLKSTNDVEVYAITLRDNVQLEDVASMVEDVFEVPSDVKLYQEGGELSLSDALRDWLTATEGKSEITLKPDLTFGATDVIHPLPLVEVWHDETSRRFSRAQKWKKLIVEYFELEEVQWHLDRSSQD